MTQKYKIELLLSKIKWMIEGCLLLIYKRALEQFFTIIARDFPLFFPYSIEYNQGGVMESLHSKVK